MLNYGEALANLSDDETICRVFDWNCEWLLRPNIAISEMASTLKDNWSNIMAYRETVFTKDFVDNLRQFVDPITDALRRVGNKDKLDTSTGCQRWSHHPQSHKFRSLSGGPFYRRVQRRWPGAYDGHPRARDQLSDA